MCPGFGRVCMGVVRPWSGICGMPLRCTIAPPPPNPSPPSPCTPLPKVIPSGLERILICVAAPSFCVASAAHTPARQFEGGGKAPGYHSRQRRSCREAAAVAAVAGCPAAGSRPSDSSPGTAVKVPGPQAVCQQPGNLQDQVRTLLWQCLILHQTMQCPRTQAAWLTWLASGVCARSERAPLHWVSFRARFSSASC